MIEEKNKMVLDLGDTAVQLDIEPLSVHLKWTTAEQIRGSLYISTSREENTPVS